MCMGTTRSFLVENSVRRCIVVPKETSHVCYKFCLATCAIFVTPGLSDPIFYICFVIYSCFLRPGRPFEMWVQSLCAMADHVLKVSNKGTRHGGNYSKRTTPAEECTTQAPSKRDKILYSQL